jgi:phage N-6-adenine-methyltransferase
MVSEVLFTSNSAEWETPQDLFNQLNEEFYLCATKANAKCARFYDYRMDGLKQPWKGVAWCNPPYGRNIGLWIAKAAEEAKKGATVVMLLPARTDTKYLHRHIWDKERHATRPGAELRLLEGRLKFGGAKNSAPFPSMVVVFR